MGGDGVTDGLLHPCFGGNSRICFAVRVADSVMVAAIFSYAYLCTAIFHLHCGW